jgi:uncharacterized protein
MSISFHAPPVPTTKRYQVTIVHDVRIPTAEPGVTLSADVYRPLTDDPVPALVTVMPYRKDYIAGATYEAPARWFAERGYASAVVDMLGTGSSDGVRRPEFDPGDGDDAVAAIDWIARQRWCDGAIGMWGMSYAANTTLRAASRQPPPLRAIIAVAHGLDASRQSVHPDGARGDLHALANRGTSLLLQQLLPPLVDYATPDAQRRWRQRLHDTEPVLLDYARHGLDDPLWSARAIDGTTIVAPALCVGGWRDAFVDGLVETYERIRVPKRLIIGGWGHLLPQDSVFGPIDFLTVALRWWDQWLRGVDRGMLAEPAVVLSLDGAFHGYRSWPPVRSTTALVADGGTLVPAPVAYQSPTWSPVGLHTPDATVGTLRGLPGLGLGESCPPQDQHDDDIRSVCATGEPLREDILIGGRPEVTVHVEPAVPRLAVRLCAVDPQGRSTLVSAGVLRPHPEDTGHRVVLRPVHHRVRAGDRLRVAVGDADFPRLTPLTGAPAFRVIGLTLSLPVVPGGLAAPVELPTLMDYRPTGAALTSWTIARDLAQDAAEVRVTTEAAHAVSRDGHRYHVRGALRATVPAAAPEAAQVEGTQSAEVHLTSGERITATARVRCTQDTLWAYGEVTIDGVPLAVRTWHAPLTREH